MSYLRWKLAAKLLSAILGSFWRPPESLRMHQTKSHWIVLDLPGLSIEFIAALSLTNLGILNNPDATESKWILGISSRRNLGCKKARKKRWKKETGLLSSLSLPELYWQLASLSSGLDSECRTSRSLKGLGSQLPRTDANLMGIFQTSWTFKTLHIAIHSIEALVEVPFSPRSKQLSLREARNPVPIIESSYASSLKILETRRLWQPWRASVWLRTWLPFSMFPSSLCGLHSCGFFWFKCLSADQSTAWILDKY